MVDGMQLKSFGLANPVACAKPVPTQGRRQGGSGGAMASPEENSAHLFGDIKI